MKSELQAVGITMLPDGRMDAKSAGRYCGLSDKTLAMKRCDGTGPAFVKVGKIFYYRDDLDAWLLAARSSSTAQSRTQTANAKAVPFPADAAAGGVPAQDCPPTDCLAATTASRGGAING